MNLVCQHIRECVGHVLREDDGRVAQGGQQEILHQGE